MKLHVLRIRLAELLLMLVFIPATLQGSGVSISLSSDKESYKIGETVQFLISFKNTGPDAVTLLPDNTVYSSDLVLSTRLGGGPSPKVLRYGEIGIDFERLAKEAVVLRPGATFQLALPVKFSRSLPKYFHDDRNGVFLVFKGMSAIELPSFGKYRFIAKHDASGDGHLKHYLRGSPGFWEGKSRSGPILLELSK